MKTTEDCIRCSKELDTEEGLQTGICPECWLPEDEDEDLPLTKG